ncbi:acyl-CoA thioesterase [Sneathiella aquimaris]|uniref:acyl-CoA thioesterase n=1 Tax=Sneathiella aquimaris TaxID=2599305 RepID=UPI001469C1C6|nr:acyl-ACP thioesterase [Sneathiella aquimaris]
MTNNNLAKVIPVYRGGVEAWECDQMLHMNVQFYSAKAMAGFSHLQNRIGLSPARIRTEKHGLRFKTLRIQYKSEMRMGALMHGVAGIRSLEEDVVSGFIHLYDTAKDTISGVFEFTADYRQLETGEPAPLPQDVKSALASLADAHPDQYCPAPMKHILLPAKPMDHMFETNRSAVDVWECDGFGQIEMRHIIGRFSDAASHIMQSVGITREIQMQRNLGSAALEYFAEFHQPIRKAASLVVKSGLLDRMDKTFAFGHHMINSDNGEIVNNTTILGCYFDMTARKAVKLPQEYHDVSEERLLKHQI